MTTSYLSDLNPRQLKAVQHGVKSGVAKPSRPLLIVAGAGTGKTKTLASRAAFLLQSGAAVDSLLICSFTRKASNELVERIRAYYGQATGNGDLRLPYAGTFHSVAAALLREFAVELGLKSNFTILGRDDAEDLIELIRTREGFARKGSLFPNKGQCLAVHSYSVNACISVAETVRKRFKALSKWQAKLRSLLRAYRQEKYVRGTLDYDDLLALLADALKHPTVGPTLRKRFRFILIDEYQDTNRLQFKILHRLKPSGRGITVVGDDAQAIYSFRAATVDNIRQFEHSFTRPARVVTLVRNYRSTRPILTASNAIMRLSAEAFEKELVSRRGSGRMPRLTTVEDDAAQAEYVVRRVLRAREAGVPLGEQAVLFRTSSHSARLELALANARVPFQKWGGLKFLDAAHIRDVLAVLRWRENPLDHVAAFRALNLVEGIGKARALGLLEVLDPGNMIASMKRTSVPKAAKHGWSELIQLFERCDVGSDDWLGEVDAVVAWYRPYLQRRFDDADDRLTDLDQLVAIAGGFCSRGLFLEQLALDPIEQFAGRKYSKQTDDDLLTLSTIHSAKGHEWSHVIVLSAVDGCMPSSRVTNREELEEERRLLYVSVTRAKNSLEVMMPRRVYHPRQGTAVVDLYVRPSRFIPERIRKHFSERRVVNRAATAKGRR